MTEQNTKPVVNPVVAATPNTVPLIPTDWSLLGLVSGYSPKSAERLRLWITGPSGEGKSTFMASIPDHIILDFDDGANAIPGSKAARIYIKNYQHYMAVTDKLIAEAKAGKPPCLRVTIDTVDEWVGMITNQLQEEKGCEDITEFGSQGHGWGLIRERCWSRLRDLEHAGYVWSCVGHINTKTETNPATNKERTVLRESVFPSFAKKITTRSDFKVSIYCVPKTVEKKEKRKLPSGQIIEVSAGSETQQVYYLSSITTVEKENKSRGVPSMERKFVIPLVGGWDLFKEKYEGAIADARKLYES